MKNEKIFEMATRTKMRFPFKGMVSTEDLWELSVKDLDTVFKVLNSQVKQVAEESLLDTKDDADEILFTKIEIIKYIVGVKLNENNVRLAEKDRKEKKEKLLSILSAKREENLQSLTEEEIITKLSELNN